MAGVCLQGHTRIVYGSLAVVVSMCVCVCASFCATASIMQQSVSQSTIRPASRVQTGWSSRLVSKMNRSGGANRPHSDHITTTQYPAINSAAYDCLQEWKAAKRDLKKGRKRLHDGREGGVEEWRTLKEKECKEEGHKVRERKSGRKDKWRVGKRHEVLLRYEQNCQGRKKRRKDKQKHKEERGRRLHRTWTRFRFVLPSSCARPSIFTTDNWVIQLSEDSLWRNDLFY